MSEPTGPTAPRRRYEPADPALAPRDGVEAPVRPVLSTRGDRRLRASLFVVAALGVAVVAAGIGLGRGTEPGPTGSAAALASGSASPVSSGSPGPTETAPPPATEMPAFGCLPVEAGKAPEFGLWPSDGSADPRRGIVGPPDWATASDPIALWPVPPEARAIELASLASIVLLPEGDACVRYAVAEYVPAERTGGEVPVLLGETNLNPPRQRVVLGSMPGGDWLLRVVAYYSTGVAGGEDRAVVERFFRVISETPVRPSVEPQITPAVPCVGRIGAVAGAFLQVGDGAPVAGLETSAGMDNAPLVTGEFPDVPLLTIEGDRCITSWDLQWLEPTTRALTQQVTEENPGEDPGFISQNRIELVDGPAGASILRADLHYGTATTMSFAWRIEIARPELPEVVATAPGGAGDFPVGGCGMNYSLNGDSQYESCGTFGPPLITPVMSIVDGDVVTVEVPGWTVENWSASCGTRGVDDSFVPVANCSLGGDSLSGITERPIQFVPPRGQYVVLLYLSVERDGLLINGPFWIEIAVEP